MTKIHAGKVAIVTGGASGIGQAIVCRLARDGARVVIADISDASETLAMVEAGGGEASAITCDISNEAQIAAFMEDVRQLVGPPAILVHCAAFQFVKAFEDVSFAEWRKTQAVNQDSMFHLLKGVLPGMKASGWGRIIVITSSTFFVGGKQLAHYVTSKGALTGLVHGLAAEIGEFGITINAVAPGLTRTRHSEADIPDEFFGFIAGLQSIPRNGRPDDQAGVVSFLASDDAAFMTGQTLLVDGGQGRT